MANAKKCDRCGNFYTSSTMHKTTVNTGKTVLIGMCFVTGNGHYIKYADLCDDCISDLMVFLEDGKKEV